MFKQLIAGLLLVAITLQILNKAVIYIDYYTNTAAYFKNCENKAKLSMHCNGKCQMMKKIQQQEKKDQQNPERRVGMDEVISSRSYFISLNILHCSAKQVYHFYNDSRTAAMPRSFFHPPGA